MPQDMRAHVFAFQRGTPRLRGLQVTSDQALDRISAERGAARGRKERVGRLRVSVAHPCRDARGCSRTRETTLIAAISASPKGGPALNSRRVTDTGHQRRAEARSALTHPQRRCHPSEAARAQRLLPPATTSSVRIAGCRTRTLLRRHPTVPASPLDRRTDGEAAHSCR